MRFRSMFFILIAYIWVLFDVPAFAQTTTLRVGTNFPASTEALVFGLARDAGIFEKQKLNVDVVYIQGGTLSMQALIGGSLDLLCSGGTPFLYSFLQGAHVKIIGGVANRLPYTFVARENITSPSQLRNKKIGISRFGSTDDLAVDLALSEFGLTRADVNIIQVGSSSARAAALKSMAIDAATLSPELTFLLRKLGFNVLLDFVKRNIEYQQVAVISRTDYLKSHAETVKRFMRAYSEGIQYFKTHKEQAIQKSMALLKVADREVAEVGYANRLSALPPDGRPTTKGLQLAIDELAKENPKARDVKVEDLLDLHFIP